MNAIVYRTAAKRNGGISSNPNLIRTYDDDHRNVTRIASAYASGKFAFMPAIAGYSASIISGTEFRSMLETYPNK